MNTTQQEQVANAKMLVQRARELVPSLQERAATVEEMRTLPAEIIEELHTAFLSAAEKRYHCMYILQSRNSIDQIS